MLNALPMSRKAGETGGGYAGGRAIGERAIRYVFVLARAGFWEKVNQ
jgi:hypothetical protein